MIPDRIGIFADVHADEASFRSAIQLLEKAGCDALLCAGDLVERGKGGDAIIAYIRDQGIPCVQGNHDENALRHAKLWAQSDIKNEDDPPLKQETLDFLEQLPEIDSYYFGNTSISMAHAIPSDIGGAIFHDDAVDSFSKRFKKDLARIDSEILVVAHTHYPCDLTFRGKRILNPGSICRFQPRDSHTFGILDLRDMSFTVHDSTTGEAQDLLVASLG
jgi:putative phosphoesterase